MELDFKFLKYWFFRESTFLNKNFVRSGPESSNVKQHSKLGSSKQSRKILWLYSENYFLLNAPVMIRVVRMLKNGQQNRWLYDKMAFADLLLIMWWLWILMRRPIENPLGKLSAFFKNSNGKCIRAKKVFFLWFLTPSVINLSFWEIILIFIGKPIRRA